MKPGDVVRLKTGDGPLMVIEGPACSSNSSKWSNSLKEVGLEVVCCVFF